MKKLLILVTVAAAAGCSEEIPLPEQTTEAPPAEFREETLQAEQEAQRQIALMTVTEAVQGYRMLHTEKRYPQSLNQLVDDGILDSLPDLPDGYHFTYDASSGEVNIEVGLRSMAPAPETEAEPESDESTDSESAAGEQAGA